MWRVIQAHHTVMLCQLSCITFDSTKNGHFLYRFKYHRSVVTLMLQFILHFQHVVMLVLRLQRLLMGISF
jgi:hypothetical protein